MYDIFWWSSAMSRLDTKHAMAHVLELNRALLGTPAMPPEEVTTFNLVRRLAAAQARRGGAYGVALHSKPLEGGNRRRGILPSGADLELAVEVRPGAWANLVVQAKRQFTGTGGYDQWKRWQVDALRVWASANNRTPGMLLYNSALQPFTPPGPQPLVPMGSCCMKDIRCWGRNWPQWLPPDHRSALAVTLCILPSLPAALPGPLGGDRLAAGVVNGFAMPLECLFCDQVPRLVVKPQAPQWALALLEAAQAPPVLVPDTAQDDGDAPLRKVSSRLRQDRASAVSQF